MTNDRRTDVPPTSFWKTRYAIGLVLMAAVAGYFLVTEHLAHTIGALPYALLLACLLMHVFMHRGHGGHAHHDSQGPDRPPGQRDRGKRDSS